MPVFKDVEAEDSSDPFFFVSGLAVDADGSPIAYHPQDLGLIHCTTPAVTISGGR